MPRPKNKDELLELSNSNFNKMLELIESFSGIQILINQHTNNELY
ncbi:MAG: hypothetical protein WBF48_01875 [Halarcobacter sp.]